MFDADDLQRIADRDNKRLARERQDRERNGKTNRKHTFRFTKEMLDGDAAGQHISKTMEFDNLQTFLNARKRFRNDMFTGKIHNNTLLTPKGRYKIVEVE